MENNASNLSLSISYDLVAREQLGKHVGIKSVKARAAVC
jgi:hypothetical protein